MDYASYRSGRFSEHPIVAAPFLSHLESRQRGQIDLDNVMRLEQSRNAVDTVSDSLRATLYMRTDRNDEQFMRDMMEAMQDYRQAKGAGPIAHDRAYSAAFFFLRRLKSRGWQFSPPLPIPNGGVLQGTRRVK